MSKTKILKGIASLFKSRGKDVAEGTVQPSKVFMNNLVETFGEKEVQEGVRIINNKYKNPELEKLFFKEGESKADDLVNLLEARYMGSPRLQAHPLSFNRRGPGAADRYLKLNETGERLTDLPGGPGDSSIYGKNFGEMSETVIGGKKVYDTPPSIFEEGTRITDEGILIEGKAVQDSLYEKTIADMPLINRMMKETGKTETEIREAIADLANEGYQAGSPKRMSAFDDDRIRAFVSNKETIPGDKEDFVTDMMEALGEGPRKQMDNLIAGMTDESDVILQNMKKMEAEAKAMTEIARAEQTQMGEAIEAFNRMLDDGEEPAAALEFLKNAMKRTKQADGGRVEMALGGAAKGIMEAIKLASRGIKPFGQKQTYKQKVTTKGVSKEQFDEIFEKQLNRVPDEVSDEATGRGLYQSLLEAEAVITGQKLGLLSQAQRTQIAKAMTEKVSKQIYDNPVSGLNNDYLEYMDDAIGRMDAILEIEKLGGDLTPKPIYDGREIIAAGIDFSQLDKLGTKAKDNIIPFKPRDKKAKGGLMSLLRAMGMKAPDKIADKKQIENVIRDPKTELERRFKDDPVTGTPATPRNQPTIDEIRDMIQKDPRYNKLTRAQMDMVVRRETIRADFAYNMGIKPEEVGDDIVDLLLMEGYDQRFGFNMGGHISEQEYNLMMQRAAENQSAEMAGRAFQAFEAHGQKPIMVDEPPLGLFGNITDDFKSYNIGQEVGDDLFLNVGMAEPPSGDPMFNLKLTKQFANGGTVPPQKGPMSDGVGTLYRSK